MANNMQQQEDDQILFLYNQLMNQPFNQKEIIFRIEKSLYMEINQNPNDNLAPIALMQAQTMLGNYDKAKAFAYKLWDKGNVMIRAEKYLYINNLLNLGLMDMASSLLKPCFDNLSEEIKKYYPIMLKFATMRGNVYLLERLINNPQAPEEDIYKKVITAYKNYNYVEHFKNVQKIILKELNGKLCVYDYDLENFPLPQLKTDLYVSAQGNELEELENGLKEKLQGYYAEMQIEKLSNFDWKMHPVFTHKALGLS